MCWNHRAIWDTRSLERERWSQPARRDEHLRVSDADREAVISRLSKHTGDGRLTLEEFEARVDEVMASKTRGELDATLRELPVEGHPVRARRRHLRRGVAWIPIIAIAVVVLSPGALWWLIPVAFFTLGPPHHRHYEHHDPRHEELTSA